ncbi:LLM class flavin-dependent oxidoreductase [Agromyces aerolatus]|uniref:LLM class flavin-dependent oxidoreductase n=1 Tax=Agromyces sp. LY-1074 TaxID=3074080 RepID=UPI00285D8868|nr:MULTISPECIES: LLM class flavin-dependent oxidoreductase [unclassified Agromyces]MDR5701645.1 LLM class flavin-dependent oxidoreductase [Agromyces sp. LY-1074]MDR5707915.1 LLM class flavin-dependent oxidoreductase [Agromyces sp. LY-1358]
MKFDVFFVCEDPHDDADRAYREVLDQIVLADELGFNGAWLAEHHGSRYGSAPEPAVLLAAAATRTSRIKLGPGVSILPFTHPVHTAAQYAMVDRLSGGRLAFGTGRGYQPREFDTFGLDAEKSRQMYAESVQIIRGLWENDTFEFAGEYYRLPPTSLHPRPAQDRVPMWVAAASPESFAAAADLGVQVFTQPSLRQTMEEMRTNMNSAIDAYLDRGYDRAAVDIPVNIIIHLAETTDQARLQAETPLKWHFETLQSLAPGAGGTKIAKGYESYKSYGPLSTSPTAGGSGDGRLSIDSLNRSGIAIIGDAEYAKAAIARMRDEFDLQHISCFIRFGGIEHEAVERSLRILARDVIPEFA